MHPFSYIKDFEATFSKAKITILKREDYGFFKNEDYVDYGSLTKTSDYYVRLWT